MKQFKKPHKCNKIRRHYYDCDCLPCQAKLAVCKCSFCVERRTRFSGRFVDGKDYSRYPSLQQLVDLENK